MLRFGKLALTAILLVAAAFAVLMVVAAALLECSGKPETACQYFVSGMSLAVCVGGAMASLWMKYL
jgi:hypothetical protein